MALSIEVAELNELFLWKKAEDADPQKIKEELADVFAFALQLAENTTLTSIK
ncbi:MazG-like family protein [Parapedobacter sp. GCM10030251]|uniref:MazG-like family protein n=1 Tax=Parapedobacter sp. GCM10030251 TaxID=3273419 RepID=UPI00361028FD